MRAIGHIALCLDEIELELAEASALRDDERSSIADAVASARSAVQAVLRRNDSAASNVVTLFPGQPVSSWARVAADVVQSQLQAQSGPQQAAPQTASGEAGAIGAVAGSPIPFPGSRRTPVRRALRVAVCGAIAAALGLLVNLDWMQARDSARAPAPLITDLAAAQ